MKGGAYGFGGALDGGTNGALWTKMDNLAATPGGALIPNNAELGATRLSGGRRRRTGKGKKVTRKGRKGGRRRKTMRGGASWYSPANSGGSFAGDGRAGLISLRPYDVDRPSGGPVEGADGAMQTSS